MQSNRVLEENCRFATDRLVIASWKNYALTINDRATLLTGVISILTPEVTKALPPGWQDIDTMDKANTWVEARLQESALFAVQTVSDHALVGFVILNGEKSTHPELVDVYLGYLLSEATWGKGLGSELIQGLVAWCESSGIIASISGGVEVDNLASIRVMEKNGFSSILPDQATEGMLFLKRTFSSMRELGG